MTPLLTVLNGDAITQLTKLPDRSVQCCVTSPPYWGLRDYGCAGQLGLEKTPEEYVCNMVQVFREVRRVLKDDGTLWLNLGDSYAGSGKGPSNEKPRPNGSLNDRQLERGAAPKEWIPVNGSKGQRIGSNHGESGHTSGVAPPPGLKSKDLVGIPWMIAFALRADGWYLRSDIIWHKPNPMPESVTDRPTKSHEYLFLLTKSQRYYYDADAVREPYAEESLGRYDYALQSTAPGSLQPGGDIGRRERERYIRPPNPLGRNRRSVWSINSEAFRDAHFATYPPDLIKPCILAGSKPGDTILDPFGGSGTTGMVALELGRKAVLIELNAEYVKLIEKRCDVTPGLALA